MKYFHLKFKTLCKASRDNRFRTFSKENNKILEHLKMLLNKL